MQVSRITGKLNVWEFSFEDLDGAFVSPYGLKFHLKRVEDDFRPLSQRDLQPIFNI